jgi:hypothetical protein
VSWRRYQRDLGAARRTVIKRAEWDRWQQSARRRQRVQAVLGIAFIALLVSTAIVATWRAMMWFFPVVL